MKEKSTAFRTWLEEKKVAVIGLGISGEGMLETLEKLGVESYVFDRKKPDTLAYGKYLTLDAAEEIDIDLAVISPGVPLTSPEANFFLKRGIPLIGEMEFAYRLTDRDFVCITGTNGKTTTTSLCGEIFARYGKSKVVGNIGIPAAPYALQDYDLYVAEISSFQIETLVDFRPKICAVLNITPDHLDRHGTFESYIGLKLDLLKRAEIRVMNADCPVLAEHVTEAAFPGVYRFSAKRKLERGAFVEDGKIYTAGLDVAAGMAPNVAADGRQYICDVADIHLMGEHNIENVLAACLVARLYGVPAEMIRISVSAFRAVEHRIEYVKTVEGIRFYNDSKGTNPDSTIKAIEAMDAPCHLIAGGYEKNSDFTEMLQIGKGKIASLSLIGVTAERIRGCALGLGYSDDKIGIYPTLKEAVLAAFASAEQGEIVLLSPASASWGMYKDFEERGRDFKSVVMEINGKHI